MKWQRYEVTFVDAQEIIVSEVTWTATLIEVLEAASTYIEANPDLGIIELHIKPEGK